jgi:flagellar basal body-associated protein FliL
MEHSTTKKEGKDMSIWIILAVIAVWVLLQAYILPKMGIST